MNEHAVRIKQQKEELDTQQMALVNQHSKVQSAWLGRHVHVHAHVFTCYALVEWRQLFVFVRVLYRVCKYTSLPHSYRQELSHLTEKHANELELQQQEEERRRQHVQEILAKQLNGVFELKETELQKVFGVHLSIFCCLVRFIRFCSLW